MWVAHFFFNLDINECDSNPCQNEGTCHNENNKYRCTCLPGWKGTNCEIGEYSCKRRPDLTYNDKY